MVNAGLGSKRTESRNASIAPADLATFVGCFTLYYVVYARYYLTGEVVHGSDTHGMWSVEYLAFYSIAKFGEFAWWDPTGLEGWPIYSSLLNWTFSYFNPFTLPYLVGFKVFSLFKDITPHGINEAIVLQKVVYFFVLNLIGVMLISREVVKTTSARVLIAVLFTLGVIQFQGFRDSHQYMALPGAIFFVWSLMYYDRRRTIGSFFTLVLFSGLYLSTASYVVTLSALYWTGAFAISMCIFRRTLLTSIVRHVGYVWQSKLGKVTLLSSAALFVLALVAPLSSVAFNVGHLMRITGDRPLNWSDGVFGDWPAPHFGVPSYELWSNLMYFAASPRLHDIFLKFDPYNSGVDHRYVGLVVLPLFLAALVLGFRHRFFAPLFLTTIICVVFIPYTTENLAYFTMMHFKLFQNVRSMGGVIARDGPALFIVLMAGIGLDQLRRPAITRNTALMQLRPRIMLGLLVALIAGAVVSFYISFLPPLRPLRGMLIFTAFYLGLFTLLTLLLYVTPEGQGRRNLLIILVALTITDLVISGSQYFLRRPGYMLYKNQGPWSKPAPHDIGPITYESESWAGKYRGIVHQTYSGPVMGLREWLILENRPKLAHLLENWNRKTKFMRAYPHFRFYTAGRFIPYDAIKERIDAIEVPAALGQWAYVHDQRLAESPGRPIKSVEAKWQIEQFTLNNLTVKVSTPAEAIMVYFDNYDRFWNAYLNGKAVSIHRANFTFKAIELPAGEHIVEWRYNPYPVKMAWLLFYLALIAYCWLTWRLLKRTGVEHNSDAPQDARATRLPHLSKG